jgi:glutamate synthase (NADPH/NADH) small chain
MSFNDVLSPFLAWKNLFKEPVSIKKPLEREGAPRYRGFHQNDLDKCIGCGTCEAICQNASIDMVPVQGIETKDGDSGLRPLIDYGRCCWCGLCVDICTTESLTMSNDFTWVDSDPEAFRFVPGVDDKPWNDDELGYKKPENYHLYATKRIEMDELPIEEREMSFLEVVKGYSKDQAMKEADRCVECGICIATCPAHMGIPQYIAAIREDDMEKGLKILYETNPMSGTCGRACTHRCEDVCALTHSGDPISIRWLKRYIIDQVPAEEYAKILGDEFKSNGKKVAIIGAGPGGLTTAYYLSLMGYEISMYEANDKAGGMLRYGIPAYRLPYDQLDKDIDYIASQGVKINYNSRVGKDVMFEDLMKDHDAVFCSTGMDIPYKMGLDGEEDNTHIMSGLEILDDATRGKDPRFGKSVVVIGGGSTAMDAASTARRFGAEATVLYRRREEDMPAECDEIKDAKVEGVKIVTQAIPLRIENAENGQVRLVWNKAEMVDDGSGKRPRPVPIEGDIHVTQVDTIIPAIGQEADYSYFPDDVIDKLTFKWGKVKTDMWGQTAVPKIFAGGDIVNPTADAITAIADGHRAAKGIDKYLQES